MKDYLKKKTDRMPLWSSYLPIWVSNSSEVWQWILGLSTVGTYCQKLVKTGGELALNKDFCQNKHIDYASKRLKLSETDLTYFLCTLVKAG